jgi:hypothetical protein
MASVLVIHHDGRFQVVHGDLRLGGGFAEERSDFVHDAQLLVDDLVRQRRRLGLLFNAWFFFCRSREIFFMMQTTMPLSLS